MKEIVLTQGKVALVDDEDFERLNRYKWCVGSRYATRTKTISPGKQTTVYMHREVVGCVPPGFECDHIDGDCFNNQKSNLRIVNHRINGQNLHIKMTSQYPGVCWHKQNAKWMAQIKICGERKYLGTFLTEEEAFAAYKKAVDEIEVER